MAKIRVPLSSRLIGVTLSVSVIASACSRGGSPEQGGFPPAQVQAQVVETTTVRVSSEFVGQLEAQTRAAIRPEMDGRIVEINVSPGDNVAPGMLLIRLEADQNQAEVSGAGADVEAAIAARQTAEAQLQAARAEVERASSDVRLREVEYERTRQLVEEGARSQQELDEATNALETARAAERAAQEDVVASERALEETDARVARAEADREAATADLDNSQVTAPIAGVVGNIPVKVGDYVTTDDSLTSVIQNQSFELNISVPIERSPRLRAGLPVELLDEQGQPLGNGRISFVSPEVNATEQSILAKANFPNDGRLRDGQFVRARVVWESSPGILVPAAAVTRVAGQTFVYVTEAGESSESGEPQPIARQRLVELGHIQGNDYQVISGVQPGEQVIVTGVLNLTDGAPIMVMPPETAEQPGTNEPPVSTQ
ncbi:MAG: efflux RND transporter periplasmic adaptor subunit [Cyanobacteria bacterium RU_5_0]|nr:efflux RND transporter periplasmic adaptor subunit [Cyanobacteria bacterium RU_5_0]